MVVETPKEYYMMLIISSGLFGLGHIMQRESDIQNNNTLAVSGDADTRKSLISALTGCGRQAIEASGGNDALKILSERKVEIVISDINLPDFNGATLCRQIKGIERYKDVFFVLLATKGELHSKDVGLGAGVDEYLQKPFDPLELAARMRTGKRILLLRSELENKTKSLAKVSLIDELTGLYNGRLFNEFLLKEYESARRYRFPLSAIVADIDRFDLFTEKNGHEAVNKALTTVADVIKEGVRKSDVVSRYNGERFAVLLPNTQHHRTIELAERLRKNVEAGGVSVGGHKLDITLSLGVGLYKSGLVSVSSPTLILELAEMSLQKAKQSGGNKVCY